MRIFFAVEFPSEARRILADYAVRLTKSLPGARPVRADLIHLTLYFVGEQTPGQTTALAGLLRGLSTPNPFPLRIGQLGTFRSGRGYTLWAGLEPQPALHIFQKTLADRLAAEGYPSAATHFVPHITLARESPSGGPATGFLPPPPLEIPVVSATLFESLRQDGRLIYRPHTVRSF